MFFPGTNKVWGRETHFWHDHLGHQSHAPAEGAGLFCFNSFSFHCGFCFFSYVLNVDIYRWMQGLVILEKLLLAINHFWMGTFPQWRVLQMMQKGSGKITSCRLRMMLKILLTSLLLNIVAWSYFYKRGKELLGVWETFFQAGF